MNHYEVLITDEALTDMEEIYRYIAHELESPTVAMRIYSCIADAVQSLESMPARFQAMLSEPEHSRGLRRMLVDSYSAFYVIKENAVIVTNVLYSASDIEARLRK